MKKTIYVLLTALVLNLMNCYGAFGGTPHEMSMINTFFHYGGGTPHLNLDGIREYSGGRAFVTNIEVQKGDLKLRVEPTWKNYKYDTDLTNRKDAGIRNIWTFQGKLDFQNTIGKTGKVNPVEDADDPMLESSWADYGELVKQVAIRYADDTHGYLSEANVYTASDYTNNIPKAGLGLLWAMADRNEADFPHKWSQGKRTLNQKQNAVGFKVFYESVRSVSKTMRIIMPSNIRPDVDSIQVFLVTLQNLYALAGEEMPHDFYLDFHWYMRNTSQDQSGGTWGITPELAGAYAHGLRMDSLVEAWNLLGWFCTETGWATYEGILDNGQPNGDLSMFKQNAPTLQGYDIYHAQGILMERLTLIWGSLKHCAGIAYWMCRNNYDVGAYYAGGINYTNWQPKMGRILYRDFLNAYGNHDIRNYRQKDQLYAVDLYASADSFITLVWTDQNKFGEYDAKPRPGKLEIPNQSPSMTLTSPSGEAYIEPANVTLSVNATDADGFVQRVEFYQSNVLINTDMSNPYAYTVNNLIAGTYNFSIKAIDNLGLASAINNIQVVVNENTPQTITLLPPVNHQFKYSDGTPVKIVGHNSPENFFAYINLPFLDWLYEHGVNCLYLSVNNKESGKPQISVWKNNNPANGFDTVKVDSWVAPVIYWLNKNPYNIAQLVLFEKETLNLWTLQQQKDMITFLAQRFAACNGRIMINTEEADMGWGRLNALYDHIKDVWGSAIRLLHCNTGEEPWNGNYNTDRIHGLSFQDNVSAFDAHMKTECAKHQHWFGIASEMTGGFQPNDVGKAETLWNAGAPYNVGVEVYIACCDHQNTANGWYTPYAPVFDRLKQLKEGTVPPPTTQYTINYATNSTKQPNSTLHGASLSAGKIWAYVDVNSDIPNRPLKFYYDNTFVNNESGRPYDLGGGNGYTVADGQHTVRVDNSQGTVIATATFTVGNIVIPPDTTEPEDTIVVPPSFTVIYSKNFTMQPATELVNGAILPVGGMWFAVMQGTGTFTFSLKRGTNVPENFTDNSAPYQFKANWLQQGSYTLTVTDGTGATRTIAVTVQ